MRFWGFVLEFLAIFAFASARRGGRGDRRVEPKQRRKWPKTRGQSPKIASATPRSKAAIVGCTRGPIYAPWRRGRTISRSRDQCAAARRRSLWPRSATASALAPPDRVRRGIGAMTSVEVSLRRLATGQALFAPPPSTARSRHLELSRWEAADSEPPFGGPPSGIGWGKGGPKPRFLSCTI